jgi:hypothetical protein
VRRLPSGAQARLFWSRVVAPGCQLSVARLHATPRAQLFHVKGMRMPDPGRSIGNSSSIREVLVAWIATLMAAAIGVLLLAFHEPGTDDRRVPTVVRAARCRRGRVGR